MRIDKAEVIVTSPDRNFVTLRLTTDDGLVGLGDATLNGRELAVVAYLQEHVVPLLLGKDAHHIEDTWQFLYRSAYWRRGPVTMAAIAAVDVALWDLKARAAGMPLFQLLGGASRDRVLAYGHASGRDLPELFDSIREHQALGYRAIRIQTAVPGLKAIYGVAAQAQSSGMRYDYEPAQRADLRSAVTHAGGISPMKKIMDHAAQYQIKSGIHGPTDVSPVGMAAALHLDLAIHNFGIQEFMPHGERTNSVFDQSFSFADGYLHPGEKPGLGVELDVDEAGRYPYQTAYLPFNRLSDGTVHDW